MATNEPGKNKERIKLASAIVIFLAAGGVAWYMLGGDTPADSASQRIYICAETGKSYEHTIKTGEEEPIHSPYTKQNTGFEAEKCYWTKGDAEGEWKAKTKPTYVLWLRRPSYLAWKYGPDAEVPEEAQHTYCPDCGHEVVGHNPMPPQDLMEAAQKEGR